MSDVGIRDQTYQAILQLVDHLVAGHPNRQIASAEPRNDGSEMTEGLRMPEIVKAEIKNKYGCPSYNQPPVVFWMQANTHVGAGDKLADEIEKYSLGQVWRTGKCLNIHHGLVEHYLNTGFMWEVNHDALAQWRMDNKPSGYWDQEAKARKSFGYY